MKYQISFLLAIICFLSCKEEKKEIIPVQKTSQEEVVDKYKITPFSNSTAYPDAKLTNMIYKNGEFAFDVQGTDYKLGNQTPDAENKMCANSAKGQHIHLIVNKLPYAAKYTSKFEHDVEDGEHTVLAFLSRSYHESIKTADANILQKVTVKDGAIVSSADITKPTLTYSRPKGNYVGKDTEKVMLDFYVSNLEINTGSYVMAEINGENHKITKWQPYYIEGLEMGQNKIKLTLYQNGSIVDSPTNPVIRNFNLRPELNPEK